MNGNIFSRLISQNINQSLVNSELCRCLKEAEAIPILKKKKKHAKSNYKTWEYFASNLQNLWKVDV